MTHDLLISAFEFREVEESVHRAHGFNELAKEYPNLALVIFFALLLGLLIASIQVLTRPAGEEALRRKARRIADAIVRKVMKSDSERCAFARTLGLPLDTSSRETFVNALLHYSSSDLTFLKQLQQDVDVVRSRRKA